MSYANKFGFHNCLLLFAEPPSYPFADLLILLVSRILIVSLKWNGLFTANAMKKKKTEI